VTRRVGRIRSVAAGLAVLAGAAGLASCGAAGPVSLSLNSGSVSACYRGLPTARAALHDPTAKLRGVHRVPVDNLEHKFPTVTMPAGDSDTQVCAFSFLGEFSPGQVDGAPPNAQGHVAVVVVTSKNLRLVTSYVGDQVPPGLGRRVATAAKVSQ
jgi:hypothetical protein